MKVWWLGAKRCNVISSVSHPSRCVSSKAGEQRGCLTLLSSTCTLLARLAIWGPNSLVGFRDEIGSKVRFSSPWGRNRIFGDYPEYESVCMGLDRFG